MEISALNMSTTYTLALTAVHAVAHAKITSKIAVTM